MTSVTSSSVPPSLILPSLLIENYAWVDERLREMFYCYGVTSENYEDYMEAGLLNEHYNWVDSELEELCRMPKRFPLKPAPMNWANYRHDDTQHRLESPQPSVLGKRKYSCIDEEDEFDWLHMPAHESTNNDEHVRTDVHIVSDDEDDEDDEDDIVIA